MNPSFEKFFSIGNISVGPTIHSCGSDGAWLGSIQIFSTTNDIFLERKYTVVGIREFNNAVTEEFFNALKYLSIDKVRFDYFINSLFIFEWENSQIDKKPDISNLIKRAYIHQL